MARAMTTRERFQVTRREALSNVRAAARALASARRRLERILEGLPDKMSAGDVAIEKLEALSADGITGASNTPLADGVDHVIRVMSEALDEAAEELEGITRSIKEAKRFK